MCAIDRYNCIPTFYTQNSEKNISFFMRQTGQRLRSFFILEIYIYTSFSEDIQRTYWDVYLLNKVYTKKEFKMEGINRKLRSENPKTEGYFKYVKEVKDKIKPK